MGNYETNNGKTLKTGLIYHSGTLAKLTDEDVAELKALHIKTVINFLDEGEREKYGEDKLPISDWQTRIQLVIMIPTKAMKEKTQAAN